MLVLDLLVAAMRGERISSMSRNNWLFPGTGRPGGGIMLKQKGILDQEEEEDIVRDQPFHVPFGRKRPSWKLKGCPKCGGDLYWDEDEFTCLRCGMNQW